MSPNPRLINLHITSYIQYPEPLSEVLNQKVSLVETRCPLQSWTWMCLCICIYILFTFIHRIYISYIFAHIFIHMFTYIYIYSEFTCKYSYIHRYLHTYIYIYIHIYIYLHGTHTHIYIHMLAYRRIDAYMCVSICIHIYMYMYYRRIDAYMCVCEYMYTYIYIWIYIYDIQMYATRSPQKVVKCSIVRFQETSRLKICIICPDLIIYYTYENSTVLYADSLNK